MQLKFSLRAIFALIAVVAVLCTVLFVVPEYIRICILFVGVVTMPGPLVSLAFYGSRELKAFALGALAAYGAWLVLVGVPAAFFAMNHFGEYIGAPLSGYRTTFPIGQPPGVGRGGVVIIVPSYLVYAGLYLPWIGVPFAGLIALVGQIATRPVTPRNG